jgi:hypothetical protein
MKIVKENKQIDCKKKKKNSDLENKHFLVDKRKNRRKI